MNSKYFTIFTLSSGERKIGSQVRPASWTFSLTLHAPVEKNNAWPINRLPIDTPAWLLAGAHGQKWIRTGPHDTNMGVSNSTPPVIRVQLTGPQSQELHLTAHLWRICIKTNTWLKCRCEELLSSNPWAKMKLPFHRVHPGDKRTEIRRPKTWAVCQHTQLVMHINTGVSTQ